MESAFPGTLQAAHRLSDGTFIATFTRQIPPGPRGSLQRDTARLQLHGAEGRLLREPTMVPGREVFLGEEFGQISAVVPVPRQRRLLVGTAGPHIVLASPDSFTIRFAAPDGTVRDVFSIPGAVRPVSNEDLRLHRQSQMDRLADAPDMQERLTALLDAMPRPAAAAHLSRLLTDANGAIWLGEYAAPGYEPERWLVLHPDGRPNGTITTPAGMRLLDVGADVVLGLRRDGLGRERVYVAPIVPGDRQSRLSPVSPDGTPRG